MLMLILTDSSKALTAVCVDTYAWVTGYIMSAVTTVTVAM